MISGSSFIIHEFVELGSFDTQREWLNSWVKEVLFESRIIRVAQLVELTTVEAVNKRKAHSSACCQREKQRGDLANRAR